MGPETETSKMHAVWWKHVTDELKSSKGYLFIAKAAFNAVALIAAALTVWSVIHQLKLQRWSEALARGDKISGDLQSDKIWDRISGLRALQTYPFAYKSDDLAALNNVLAPFTVSKRAILLEFERFRVPASDTDLILNKPIDSSPDQFSRASENSDGSIGAVLLEKTVALQTLSLLGLAGWGLPDPAQVTLSSSADVYSAKVNFQWLSRREVQGKTEIDPARVLEGKDLSLVSFSQSNFGCVSVYNSKFVGARFSNVSFYLANLSKSHFSKSHIDFADMVAVNGLQADFSESYLTGISTNAAGHIHLTIGLGGPLISEIEACSTVASSDSNANFTGANFVRSQILQSDMQNSTLNASTFANATLSDSNFSRVNGRGADFSSSNLDSVTFKHSLLGNSSFRHAHVSRTDFSESVLTNVDFRDANFDSESSSSILGAETLTGANFSGSTMAGTKLFCRLIARGAVYILNTSHWIERGRPSNWQDYASDHDKAQLEDCSSNR